MDHVRRADLKPLALAIVMLAGAALASATPRLWLFTPVLPAEAHPDFAARLVETTTRLATLLRSEPRVTLVDGADDADVTVEVGAMRRTSYTVQGEKRLEHVTLTITAGQTRSVLQASAPKAKDAEADAVRKLLAWVHDHGALIEENRPQ